ncbi:hypothetical protein Goshw_009738 [Gossypium schwendimanii]|uniref:Uncharacterized protein n=1 Tax=Gossypium schwendimanii TaxID=34291 RepID=A0A7J9NDK6_GOSSC|nr:hypothetical protein [Gossypium schwendimanii]
MLEDTQSREGDCQITSFDLSLPQIVCMDCRRNREDELKGIDYRGIFYPSPL